MLRADLLFSACRPSEKADVSPRHSGRGFPKWPMYSLCEPDTAGSLGLGAVSEQSPSGRRRWLRCAQPATRRRQASRAVHLPAGRAALQVHLSLLQGDKSRQRHGEVACEGVEAVLWVPLGTGADLKRSICDLPSHPPTPRGGKALVWGLSRYPLSAATVLEILV